MIERILTLTSFHDVFIKMMTSSFNRETAINNLLKEFELCKKVDGTFYTATDVFSTDLLAIDRYPREDLATKIKAWMINLHDNVLKYKEPLHYGSFYYKWPNGELSNHGPTGANSPPAIK